MAGGAAGGRVLGVSKMSGRNLREMYWTWICQVCGTWRDYGDEHLVAENTKAWLKCAECKVHTLHRQINEDGEWAEDFKANELTS